MELIEFDYPCCISTRSSKYVNREFSATYRYQVKSGRIADVVLLRDELQIRHAARCFGFQSNEVWLTWVNRWLYEALFTSTIWYDDDVNSCECVTSSFLSYGRTVVVDNSYYKCRSFEHQYFREWGDRPTNDPEAKIQFWEINEKPYFTMLTGDRSNIANAPHSIKSSSAVAESPRDASCLSVVSFSSTIPRAPINYFGFRFTATYN